MDLNKILKLLKGTNHRLNNALNEFDWLDTEIGVMASMENITQVIEALELAIEFGITEED